MKLHSPRMQKSLRGPRHSNAGGFTLLELLVVTAIIGVLAALLLPVTAKMAENGRRSRCLGNLNALRTGFLAYMGDNQMGLPTMTETATIQQGASAPSDWIFAIQKYVPYSETVYCCPSNSVRFSSDQIKTDRVSNYAINYWMRDGMIKFPMFKPVLSPLLLPEPSKVGLLIDGASAWVKKEQPNRIAFVHNGAVNILYLDGHVASKQRSEVLDAQGQIPCMGQPDALQ